MTDEQSSRVPLPRVEGAITLHDGRHLGFAEYGPAHGKPVLWFHGTPGSRRQIPVGARIAAAQRDVRLIALERPGIGASTPHMYGSILDWARDVDEFTTRLGIDRFGLVALSGGGPYLLACAWSMPHRVVAGAVLGGVAPTRGDDAPPGGLVNFAARFAPLLRVFREPLACGLWLGARALRPFGSQAFDVYMRFSPEGDRRIFADPQMKEMFMDDLLRGSRRQLRAPVYDLVLFTRDWGFLPREIRIPIRFWHGDADNFVPLDHAEHLASLMPNAELHVRHSESHLGSLAAVDEIFDALLAYWPDEPERPSDRRIGRAGVRAT